ncbi:hypothetical protein YC2023_081723 [Brassica napus]
MIVTLFAAGIPVSAMPSMNLSAVKLWSVEKWRRCSLLSSYTWCIRVIFSWAFV